MYIPGGGFNAANKYHRKLDAVDRKLEGSYSKSYRSLRE